MKNYALLCGVCNRTTAHMASPDDTEFSWRCPNCASDYLTDITKYTSPEEIKLSRMEERRVTAEGRKDDKDKLDWALLPLYPIREVIKVLMWGEKNYDRNNWQLVVDARLRYYNAAMRHITEWFGGKKNDNDTNLHHLAHAVCCLLFLIWLDKKGYKDADKKA